MRGASFIRCSIRMCWEVSNLISYRSLRLEFARPAELCSNSRASSCLHHTIAPLYALRKPLPSLSKPAHPTTPSLVLRTPCYFGRSPISSAPGVTSHRLLPLPTQSLPPPHPRPPSLHTRAAPAPPHPSPH